MIRLLFTLPENRIYFLQTQCSVLEIRIQWLENRIYKVFIKSHNLGEKRTREEVRNEKI